MEVKIHQPIVEQGGTQRLVEVQPYEMKIDYRCIVSIDGSTSNSGVAILRETDGALLYTMAFTREKDKKEEPVRYKVQFKNVLTQMLRRFPNLVYVYYEEPIIEFVTAIPNLMMLRTMVEEIKIENEPEFNYVGNSEVNNKKWKKAFLSPQVLPNDTDLEKKMVRDKLLSYLPCLESVTQDEIDAIAMGFANVLIRMNGGSETELESKKSVKPFHYNIEFVGADDDDSAIEEFFSSFKIPDKVYNNGITLSELGPRAELDKFVYREMGQDDKLLIVKFKSDTHGDLILKHRIGGLSVAYDYLYAFIWRKARKK